MIGAAKIIAMVGTTRGDVARDFYRDTLGFKLSDFALKPFVAYFFHVNPRHHSLAIVETGKNMVHHMMMELYSLDDVGQGYDIAQGEAGRVATTLGRHTSDFSDQYPMPPRSLRAESRFPVSTD